jgi:hypothetical protein
MCVSNLWSILSSSAMCVSTLWSILSSSAMCVSTSCLKFQSLRISLGWNFIAVMSSHFACCEASARYSKSKRNETKRNTFFCCWHAVDRARQKEVEHVKAPDGFMTSYERRRNLEKTTKYLRSALFWDITQRLVVLLYRRFGTNYRSHLDTWRCIIFNHSNTQTVLLFHQHFIIFNIPFAPKPVKFCTINTTTYIDLLWPILLVLL